MLYLGRSVSTCSLHSHHCSPVLPEGLSGVELIDGHGVLHDVKSLHVGHPGLHELLLNIIYPRVDIDLLSIDEVRNSYINYVFFVK